MRKNALAVAFLMAGGLYSPLNIDFTDPQRALDPRITMTRSSAATRWNEYGQLETVSSGVARAHAYQDHDPASYSASSSTVTIGYGAKTFAVTYTYALGTRVRATVDGSNWVAGRVIAATGSSVTIRVDLKAGSGEYSSWHVIRCRGFLIEEGRTNSIRNSTMVGASAPSTSPTNWSRAIVTTSGLTTSWSDVVIDNGVPCVDFTITGTAVGAGAIQLYFDTSTAISASNGQTWTASLFCKLQSGALTGLSNFLLRGFTYTSAPAFLGQVAFMTLPEPTASLARHAAANTLSGATIAYLRPLLMFNIANGATINCTLRLGLPGLEQGGTVSSPIPSAGAATARLADTASITGSNFSSFWSGPAGSIVLTISRLASAAGTCGLVDVTDGTTSERLSLTVAGTSNAYTQTVRVAGVTEASITGNYTQRATVAAAYKLDDAALYVNGALVGVDDEVGVPTVTQMTIGSRLGSDFLNGHIENLAIYRDRLPGGRLSELML